MPNDITDPQDEKQEEATNPVAQNPQEESSLSQSPAPEMTLEEALAELEKPGKNAMRFKPPPSKNSPKPKPRTCCWKSQQPTVSNLRMCRCWALARKKT